MTEILLKQIQTNIFKDIRLLVFRALHLKILDCISCQVEFFHVVVVDAQQLNMTETMVI